MDIGKVKRKFVVLYENYRRFLVYVACGILKDQYLAEDAVHDAFLKVSQNMDKIGEPDALETKRYLITVVKNSALDIYRKRKRQMQREILMDELGESETALSYLETDVDNQVLDILKNLPVKYRDVFLLKYSSRLENKEIAAILRITEGTVRQRIARGKVLIEEALKELED